MPQDEKNTLNESIESIHFKNGTRFSFSHIIGQSPYLQRQLRLAAAAARCDSDVLITGLSGTGKEVFAQAIHNASARAGGPFVGVNCAAIPREFLESELFGYAPKSGIANADPRGKPGKFELSNGGTILLDEIGDMPLEMQAKLLRVLQERRVQRISGTRDIPVDVRVIATTNRDLVEDVAYGRFRQDLYFRLKVVYIPLPSLHERAEDIPLLATHFLVQFATRFGSKLRTIAPAVMRAMTDYPWPGNVRELEHVIESDVIVTHPDATVLDHIPDAICSYNKGALHTPQQGHPPSNWEGGSMEAEHQMDLNEAQSIHEALVQTGGNRTRAARVLGTTLRTLHNRLNIMKRGPFAYLVVPGHNGRPPKIGR